MTADIFCAFCPAGHFVSQQALTDHMERDCLGYAAERTAARPRDALAVLREALVWAQDEGALRLIVEEFHPLIAPGAHFRPVKSPPGFAASLVSKCADVAIRARLTTGGRELHIQIDVPPRSFQRTRLHLSPEFALAYDHAPVLRDSRALAERLAEAAERGAHAAEIEQ